MPSETLTIGGLSVRFDYAPGAETRVAWDRAHRLFVQPEETSPVCCLEVRAEPAPPHEFRELLADGRLWTLRRDPKTGLRRIAIHGCPQGPLTMTLDLAPWGKQLMLSGTLFLGPAPPRQAFVPLGYPLMPLLWTLLLGSLSENDGGLLCHAGGLVTPAGNGFLFAGFSGAGKSTTCRLWRDACPGAAILSDDRVIVRRDSSSPSGFALHGTPWHGDAEEVHSGHAPLRRLLILGRSPDGLRNQLVPLPPAAATAALLARTTPPIWESQGTQSALTLAADLCQSLPVGQWQFAPTSQAVWDLLAVD